MGRFVGTRPGELSSYVRLCTADSATLVVVAGMVPATCHDRYEGVLVGPGKGVSVQIGMQPLRVPIRVDGSFAFKARSGGMILGAPKMPVRVRGVFNGRTVKGRVTLTTGAWWRYTRCTADARFRASIGTR